MKRVVTSFASSIALLVSSSSVALAQPSPPPASEAAEAPPTETKPRAPDAKPRTPPPLPAPDAASATTAPDAPREPVVDGRPRETNVATIETTTRDAPAPEGAPRFDLIRINAGFKLGYVGNRAFDTFATNDALPQFSIDGTYPLLARGKLVLAAGLGWDVGRREASLRGFDTGLTTHRFYVPLEGRYHLVPSLYVFGKLAPGAALASASIEDPSAGGKLSANGWAFAADVSVGASVLLGPRTKMGQRAPRIWLTPEIGYAFTTNASLDATPGRAESELLGSDEITNLRALALSGVFWRLSLGMTF